MSPQVETMQRIHLVPAAGTCTPSPSGGDFGAPTQCQPPEHCRSAPDCPHLLCHGHPDNDSDAEFDPVMRTRFWQTYLGVLLIVVGVGVLWWIR